MAFEYVFTATTGNVRVQNSSFGFDKRSGTVTVEFDMRGVEVTDGGTDITAKILYSASIKSTATFDSPPDRWVRQKISWVVSDTFNLADYGAQAITLEVYDEDSVLCHTSAGTVGLDLDPIEYESEITSHSFGDLATPVVTFKLGDMLSEQTLVPIITVGSSNSSGCIIYLDNQASTEVNQSTNRFGCLNGVKFTETSMSFTDASPQDATYFKRINSYKITAPTMASGHNNYTINLQANAV